MPLNWNAEKVKDYDQLTKEEMQVREVLIWATIGIGMSKITEKNYREFFARVNFSEKVGGAWTHGEGMKPVYITIEDVRRFIGLYTNASEYSRAKFIKLHVDRHFNNILKES